MSSSCCLLEPIHNRNSSPERSNLSMRRNIILTVFNNYFSKISFFLSLSIRLLLVSNLTSLFLSTFFHPLSFSLSFFLSLSLANVTRGLFLSFRFVLSRGNFVIGDRSTNGSSKQRTGCVGCFSASQFNDLRASSIGCRASLLRVQASSFRAFSSPWVNFENIYLFTNRK